MNAYLETRSYSTDFPANAFYIEDNDFLAHWHLEVEMVFVCEGSIRIGINKTSKILHKGEMAIISSTDLHYYDSKDLHSSILVLIFKPELIGSSSGWPEKLHFNPAFIDKQFLDTLNIEIRNTITSIFYDIFKEMDLKEPYHELYVKGKLSELSALSLRYFPTSTNNPNEKYKKLPDIERIQYVINYLDEHYMEDISLFDISSIANLSPYYFSRLFKKFTGTNFKHYLSRIRIDKVETLLKTSEMSIIDISFECGFNSIRTFNRTFKSLKGYAPSKMAEETNK